jgi:ribose/xylose/arabinose/galactoside ABC-type transport system permease subunit
MKLRSKYIPLIATIAVFAMLYGFGCANYDNFGSIRVAANLLGDNGFLGVAAVGATFVILSGGIDLSVGSVIAATSILIATLVEAHVHPLIAIAIALAVGACFGAAMGALIHFYQQPAFMITLAGMFLARGLGFVIKPESQGITDPFYVNTIVEDLTIPLGSSGAHLAFTAVCFLIVLAIGIVIAHFTRFGRAVYAVGDDEHSANLMGVPVARTKVLVYTLAGFCSALAGVVYTFYTQSGDPLSCVGFELDAIASAVIGGTLLSGGVGFVAGTAIGVLILGLIQTLINFQGDLNSWWTRIVVGLLVLLFIGLQNIVTAFSSRQRKVKGSVQPSAGGVATR